MSESIAARRCEVGLASVDGGFLRCGTGTGLRGFFRTPLGELLFILELRQGSLERGEGAAGNERQEGEGGDVCYHLFDMSISLCVILWERKFKNSKSKIRNSKR